MNERIPNMEHGHTEEAAPDRKLPQDYSTPEQKIQARRRLIEWVLDRSRAGEISLEQRSEILANIWPVDLDQP
jgi:hypothetical protein